MNRAARQIVVRGPISRRYRTGGGLEPPGSVAARAPLTPGPLERGGSMPLWFQPGCCLHFGPNPWLQTAPVTREPRGSRWIAVDRGHAGGKHGTPRAAVAGQGADSRRPRSVVACAALIRGRQMAGNDPWPRVPGRPGLTTRPPAKPLRRLNRCWPGRCDPAGTGRRRRRGYGCRREVRFGIRGGSRGPPRAVRMRDRSPDGRQPPTS